MRLLLLTLALGAGIPIQDGTTHRLAAKVSTGKSLATNRGPPSSKSWTFPTALVSASSIISLEVDANASVGFRVQRVCWGSSSNTTAGAIAVVTTLSRVTSASSNGNILVAEFGASPSYAVSDISDGDFPGTARNLSGGGGLNGTVGATLDQWGITTGETSVAGLLDLNGPQVYCKNYGLHGEKMPTIPAGKGVVLVVGSSGTGSGNGSASMTVIVDT